MLIRLAFLTLSIGRFKKYCLIKGHYWGDIVTYQTLQIASYSNRANKLPNNCREKLVENQMIKGNYSLAKEVRKNELKQKQKIQQRQKDAHRTNKLLQENPILIFRQIQKLEKSFDLDTHQQKKLQKLRDDWTYILKNKLHREKLDPFLEKEETLKAAREKEQTKLRGKESIYFNPELNPLGKVPILSLNESETRTTLPNLAKPLKKKHQYPIDPLISELNIRPPKGSPPRFYKNVQNVSVKKLVPSPASNSSVLSSKRKADQLDILESDDDTL